MPTMLLQTNDLKELLYMVSRTLCDYPNFNELLYVINREQKTLQTLHKTLHLLHISLIIRMLHCVGFKAKILHKPCMEPYMGTKSQRV